MKNNFVVILLLLSSSWTFSQNNSMITLENQNQLFRECSENANNTAYFLELNPVAGVTRVKTEAVKQIGPFGIVEFRDSLSFFEQNKFSRDSINEKCERPINSVQLSVLPPCMLDKILEHDFYDIREINTSVRVIFAPKGEWNNPDSLSNKFTLFNIRQGNPEDSVRIKIIDLPENPLNTDRISIVFKPIVHHLLTEEEFLVLHYTLFHFFKAQIMKNSEKIKIKYDPFSVLIRDELPVYAPLISIQAFSNLSIKIISQWPQISDAMLKYVQFDNLEKSRQDLLNHIQSTITSVESEVTFLVRAGMIYGQGESLKSFEVNLENLDINESVKKLHMVISGKLYHIYWGARALPEEKNLKKIDTFLKYENIENN